MGEYNGMGNTFAALADPTRRAILQQLMDGPARVTELARPHDISLNSISKHLKLLEKANLVNRDIKGRDHWIQFNREPLEAARDWASTMLEFWTVRFDALEELVIIENTQENIDD
jgi:DNA-binding transcriptional ArsR family regulator